MGIRSVFTKVFSLPPSLPHTLPLYQGLPLSRTYQISLGHRVGFRLDLIHNSSSERLADDRARLNRQMMRIFLSLPSALSLARSFPLSLSSSLSRSLARELSRLLFHTHAFSLSSSLSPPLARYRSIANCHDIQGQKRAEGATHASNSCHKFAPSKASSSATSPPGLPVWRSTAPGRGRCHASVRGSSSPLRSLYSKVLEVLTNK